MTSSVCKAHGETIPDKEDKPHGRFAKIQSRRHYPGMADVHSRKEGIPILYLGEQTNTYQGCAFRGGQVSNKERKRVRSYPLTDTAHAKEW